MEWLTPWRPLKGDEGRGLEREAVAEIGKKHPLYGATLTAIARSEVNDDVLFFLNDTPRVAVIHLTWSRHPEPAPWPDSVIYESLACFADGRMKGDHNECIDG